MRAFLPPLWASLLIRSAETRSCSSPKRPSHCVLVKQLRHALLWIKAFLELEPQRLVRCSGIPQQWPTYTSGHRRQSMRLGGMLVVSHVIVLWFAVPLTEFDASHFKCPIGDSKGQQVWEALAMLVALRFW